MNFDTELLKAQLNLMLHTGMKVKLSNMKPSEWTERNLVMGKPFPGPFRYSRTPYTREIIDCFAPDHPCKWLAVKKSAQIGFSAGVIIPVLCWIIQQSPANTFFSVGSPKLVEKAVEKLDLAIDGAKIRALITSQVKRKKNMKTGDTNTKKDFIGGFIEILSATNHKDIRDVSLKYGLFDDWEALAAASKQSGSTRKLLEKRFTAYATSHKIAYISTPELFEGSNIEEVYQLGDKRKYMVPCPECHDFIELLWEHPEGGGMYWECDKNGLLIPSTVQYVCPKCACGFKDTHKQQMLIDGYWNPTATAKQEGFYSYHINALYGPTGMYGWKAYVNDYIQANPKGQPRIEKDWHVFVNTVLGECYAGNTTENKATNIMRNIRPYDIGTIPENLSLADGNGRIVLITCSADMNGKMKGPQFDENDARLDYEVVAHSESGATYSIEQGSIGTFKPLGGNKDEDRVKWTYEHNAPNSVWPEFERILGKTYKTDNGREMGIIITGLDCGAYASNGAYPFLENTKFNVRGLKGNAKDDYVLQGKNMKPFRLSAERKDMWILETGVLKDRQANYMNLNWNTEEKQPPNFMNYPEPANGLYGFETFFEHYEAEHKVLKADKIGNLFYRWVKKRSDAQNHFWDCRLYNMAIRDIFIQMWADAIKEKDLNWEKWAKQAAAMIK